MQKKSGKSTSQESDDKRIIEQAGEIIGSIGHYIMEGKEKIVDSVSNEFKVVKKAIEKVIC